MPVTTIHSIRLFDGHKTHPSAAVSFSPLSGKITNITIPSPSSPKTSLANTLSTSTSENDITIIDGTGYTLLPGLIESHVHVYDLHLPPGADHSQVLKIPLKCGVTTVADMHSDPGTIHGFKKAIGEEEVRARAGEQEGRVVKVELCDLKSSLYGATIEGGWPKPIVLAHEPSEELKATVATWPSLTPSTAPSFIRSHKSQGADYIKLMQENCCSLALPDNSIPVATLELQKAVVEAAHAADLKVVGHATARISTEIILKSGADGLTHTFIDQPPSDEMLPLFQANKAFVIPTLVVLSSLTGELQSQREKFAEIAKRLNLVDDFSYENARALLGMKAPHATIENAFETIRWYKKNNIDVVAGTDSAMGLKGTCMGVSLWMELELYVKECGMSCEEALRCATSVPAERFGWGDRGVVEEGRRADLVLVKGDVTRDIGDFWEEDRGVGGVWKGGIRAV